MARDRQPETGRRVVSDLAALRVLTHPERAAILKLLMSGKPRTATECAEFVAATPSACSYHLRQLERFGFIERAEPDEENGDGRTRLWKAAAIGFSLGAGPFSEATPAELAVFHAVRRADRIENERLELLFGEHFDELAPEWQDAAEFANYELTLTPAEADRLVEAVDRLLLPYRVGARTDAPAEARTVHVQFSAFRRIDV